MRLYLIHCGYYDAAISGGIFENHSNILICAASFEDAREKVRIAAEFKGRKMHIDGIFEVDAVDGYRLQFVKDPTLEGKTSGKVLKYGSRSPREVSFGGA